MENKLTGNQNVSVKLVNKDESQFDIVISSNSTTEDLEKYLNNILSKNSKFLFFCKNQKLIDLKTLDKEEVNVVNFVEISNYSVFSHENQFIKCFCFIKDHLISLLYNNSVSIKNTSTGKKDVLQLNFNLQLNQGKPKIEHLSDCKILILTNFSLFILDFINLNIKLVKENVDDFDLFITDNSLIKVIFNCNDHSNITLGEIINDQISEIKEIKTQVNVEKIFFSSLKHFYYTDGVRTVVRHNLLKNNNRKISIDEFITDFLVDNKKIFVCSNKGIFYTVNDFIIEKQEKMDFCRFVDKIVKNREELIFISHKSVYVTENGLMKNFMKFGNQINDMKVKENTKYFAVGSDILELIENS